MNSYWLMSGSKFRVSVSRLHNSRRTGIDFVNNKSIKRMKIIVYGYFIHFIFWHNTDKEKGLEGKKC